MRFHVRVLSKETGLSPINTYDFGNTKECIDFSRNYRFCSEYHYKEIGADIWSKVYFDGVPELLPLYQDMLNGCSCYHCLTPHFEADKRTIKTYGVPTLCDECSIENAKELKRLRDNWWTEERNILGKRFYPLVDAGYIPESNKAKCFYCGEQFNDKLISTRDHVFPKYKIPKSRPHMHLLLGRNYVHACQICNAFKKNHMVSDLLPIVETKRSNETDVKLKVKYWRMELQLKFLIEKYPHLC